MRACVGVYACACTCAWWLVANPRMEWCRYGYHIDGTLVTQTCLGKGTSRMQQVRFVEPSKVKTAFPHIRFWMSQLLWTGRRWYMHCQLQARSYRWTNYLFMYVGHSHYGDLSVCQPAACLHGCSVKVICSIRYFFCAIDYKLVMEFISQQQSSVIDLRSLKIAFYGSR